MWGTGVNMEVCPFLIFNGSGCARSRDTGVRGREHMYTIKSSQTFTRFFGVLIYSITY